MSSLSFLNAGQALVLAIGMTALMILAGFDYAHGRMSEGDFVAVNTFLIQLAVPLNMMGFVYREIKQALVDTERMFALREVPREIEDKPGAPDLAGLVRRSAFRGRRVSL